MSRKRVSVIVPTHNRPEKLAATIAGLRRQTLPASDYEIVVVDDRSLPPAVLPEVAGDPAMNLIRLEGEERSAARNQGALAATGDLLVFLDDDMTVERDFLSNHLAAYTEWPGSLAVGAIRLPERSAETPFGRFRQNLEDSCIPGQRGPVSMPNLCAAGNMSIAKRRFEELGGFDPAIVSSEDQDLALRHTAAGGTIAYLPEARAIHCDSSLDIRSYCIRCEWGSRNMAPFCDRYSDRVENVERESVNGALRLGREPLSQSAKKLIKSVLALRPFREALFVQASILERLAPGSGALNRTYRLLLGTHIFRGYRQGLVSRRIDDDRPRITDSQSAPPSIEMRPLSQPNAK